MVEVLHTYDGTRRDWGGVSRPDFYSTRNRDSLTKSGSVCETAMVTRELLVERELLSLVGIAGEISTPLPCALGGKSHLPLPIVTDGSPVLADGSLLKTRVNSTGAITESSHSSYPSFPRDLLLSSPFFKPVKRVSQPLLVKRGGGGGPSGPLV